jgi:cbb3-type cytochrome c oxidase subunit III
MRLFKVAITTLVLAAPGLALADDVGQDLFNKKCATCHGKDGNADTKMGHELNVAKLTDAALQAKITDDDIVKQITNGNKEKKMPAFKEKFSEDEIKAVAAYVRTFKK